MKIKLELTGQTLTPKQKELITEKLEEIRAIVKNKKTKKQVTIAEQEEL